MGNGDYSMRWFAEALECDAANAAGLADKLVERGLVVRSTSKTDHRLDLLNLAPEGRDAS